MPTSSINSPDHTASFRGERLYPARTSRLYWHLTCLRTAIMAVIKDHLAEFKTCTVIDYGCGNMPYRPLWEPHTQQYLGYDFADNPLADGFLNADGTLPVASESADIILSSQVLEHVLDPNKYLGEAFRVLKCGGRLILTTHGVWRYHPDPTDFWRWTCDGLRRQISACQFDILHFEGVMGPEATALQLWQDAMLSRIPRRLKRLFTLLVQGCIRRADQRCSDAVRNKDACVYIIVATKPIPR